LLNLCNRINLLFWRLLTLAVNLLNLDEEAVNHEELTSDVDNIPCTRKVLQLLDNQLNKFIKKEVDCEESVEYG
jgi:hypothetical protein